MRSLARMIACVLLLWVVFYTTSAISFQDLDSEVVETEIGWQFEDDTEVFTGSQIAAPPPGTKPPKDQLYFMNGDFELTTVTSNGTVLADATMIPNWLPGGAGVQIIQSSTYQMSNFAPGSVFAIHLNNPVSTGNSTQGSIGSLNFTWAPKPATLYTVQFDCARMPDEPLNLYPALKVSSMSGSVVNYYTLHSPTYNITDTPKQITWIRQSFLFMGTGARTSVLFESMSEKYGPVIDNVVILSGIHILHPNSAPLPASLLPLMYPILTVVALTSVHTEALFLLWEAAGVL